MEINLKKVRMEDIFPVMDILDGVAVSVRGAFTIGWELSLPVAYTLDEDEYDEMQEAMVSALRVLPPWTVMHRQDMYLYERYESGRTWEPGKGAYLESCYDRHFEGRRYLTHRAYLFLTFGDGYLFKKDGKRSGLFGLDSRLTLPPRSKYEAFLTKGREFMRVATMTGRFKARELTREDWLGDGVASTGIVQRYMMLGEDGPLLSDAPLSPSTVEVHGKVAQGFVVAEARHLSTVIASVKKNERMSDGPCEMFLSLGANLGIKLDCEHVVNHYVLVPPQAETLNGLDSKRKSMNAGITSRDNRVNYGEISAFLDDAERENYLTVYTHLDVIAWGTEKEQSSITSKISAALMDMGMASAVKVENNLPVLYYAGIPSAEVDLGMENMMTQEVHAALCLGTYETFEGGLGRGDLRLCDRLRNIPVITDVDEVSASMGLNNAYSKFVVGPTGTGKSFIMNRLLNCEYNAGAMVFIIDIGDSYEGQTRVINETSGGADGQYMSWNANNIPSFNPFVGFTRWVDRNGNLAVFSLDGESDDSGVDYMISIIQTLYTPPEGWTTYNEPILKQILLDFVKEMLSKGKSEEDLPVFDDLCSFIGKKVSPLMKKAKPSAKKTRGKAGDAPDGQASSSSGKEKVGMYKVGEVLVGTEDFDIDKFLTSLTPYSATGPFAFFYNSHRPVDLFSSRWMVSELYNVSQVKDQTFYSLVVLQLMHSFDMKMRSAPGRKVLVVDEAWQAIMNKTMAPYLKSLWKTCRKYNTAAIVVTQEIADITGSEVIKDAILANSDIKILLNQVSNRGVLLAEEGKDDSKDIRKLLGLTHKDVALLLSMDKQLNPEYNYREVFIKYSNGYSAVYANEVSREELLAYESNKKKKAPLFELAARKGSFVEAINQTISERK